MGKWLTRVNEQGSNNNDFQNTDDHFELKLRYNKLLEREKDGEKWLNDPCRTEIESEKGLRLFNEVLKELNKIIDQIGLNNCTEAERMNGFELLSLLGTEVSPDEFTDQWK